MGLMDRDYMNRTPEEREAERFSQKKHQDRLNEMATLMHKGEHMTKAERKRLNQIFEENRAYMDGKNVISHSNKKSSSIVPIVIFIVVLIFIVLTFYFNPDLASFNIWN